MSKNLQILTKVNDFLYEGTLKGKRIKVQKQIKRNEDGKVFSWYNIIQGETTIRTAKSLKAAEQFIVASEATLDLFDT